MYDGAYGAQAKTETQQHKQTTKPRKHKPNTNPTPTKRATGTSRSAGKPVRSLVDWNWKSGRKITLDLPWQPARAGRQEERESIGGGVRREGKRQGGGVKRGRRH